jgi:hypothetical protein
MAASGSYSLVAGGSNPYGYQNGVFGTLSPTKVGTNTITKIRWDNSTFVILTMSGTSVANTDATFAAMLLGGNLFTRASATYTANDGLGGTQWAWSAVTLPTSGAVPLTMQ